MPAATLSYAIGAGAFAAMLGLLLLRWRQRLGGAWLALACFATVVWCAVSSLHATTLAWRPAGEWVYLTEALRTGIWLTFMLTVLNAGRDPQDRTPQRARWAVTAVWVAAPVLVGL
ncbi:MAG: hypothetical protein AAFX85_05795, partial [Pseudomonadota bacterium]